MIHPTAVVSPKAELDSTVEIGPYAIVENHVKMGARTKVMAHAYVTGYTEIGEDNQIHMGAVIGHFPQDLKFDPSTRSYLKVGHRNVFREYATVHRGTELESSTVIGSDNFLMGGAHVAHNCHIGNKVIICNYAVLAGHSHVADQVFISASVMIHQFIHVGRLVMFSGGAGVSRDVPPFMMACERNEIWSINLVGLQRGGVSPESVKEIKRLYKIFYRSGLNITNALKKIEEENFQSSEVKEFVEFIKNSPNGVLPHREM
ncbi:MAG: acyl-ACP--UDP-N-acetylglucosamine O-acyltransferase [Chlamydiae bacterium]|nr:acyl-ACP--UDP-N-acetylglucosamine O-acyltransferase [Chlamydiota bacterium]MBI3276537.1 acyl-ACP--UDP-N-acetylglucosamine O-acyltransferase [Chlamydiota bacterium]